VPRRHARKWGPPFSANLKETTRPPRFQKLGVKPGLGPNSGGWFVEPSYSYSFGSEHEQLLGVSFGLLIATRVQFDTLDDLEECQASSEPKTLPVFWGDELAPRKARHLNVCEALVGGLILSRSLDVFACVGRRYRNGATCSLIGPVQRSHIETT
jgi:hypothetical protein